MIIYEGPSQLDGSPIVAVATGLGRKSHNAKTGDAVQVWILRADLDPLAVSKAALDGSICGTCPHRRSLGGACYVTLHQAPLSVFRAYKRGSYETAAPADLPGLFAGRVVRLGAYGDPSAVPLAIWEGVCAEAASWLGYTHQWETESADALGRFCMASVDSPAEFATARLRGWRTFRVRAASEPLRPGEFACPAAAESGHRVTCAQCKACGGAGRKPRAACPAIVVHGTLAKRFKAAA